MTPSAVAKNGCRIVWKIIYRTRLGAGVRDLMEGGSISRRFAFPLIADQLSIIMKKSYLPFLLTVFVSVVTVTTQAQSTIVLTPECAGHTATRLNSGKVLITGGVNENATLNSALLYDSSCRFASCACQRRWRYSARSGCA